jgi:thiol-disulfide isomerase/thioredoxin
MKKIACLILFSIALSPVLRGQEKPNQDAARQETVVQPAPPFALKDLRGKTVTLENFKGKILLLNFWASWCVPCRAEMPELIKLQTEYAAKGLQVVGVTYEPEKPLIVNRIARTRKINYPLLFGNKELSVQYGIEDVLPVTFVIDREGKIRDRVLGTFVPSDFEQKVLPMLK